MKKGKIVTWQDIAAAVEAGAAHLEADDAGVTFMCVKLETVKAVNLRMTLKRGKTVIARLIEVDPDESLKPLKGGKLRLNPRDRPRRDWCPTRVVLHTRR